MLISAHVDGLYRHFQRFVEGMPESVIEAVEKILNRLTDGLHETTRLNKRKIHDIKLNPNQLLTLKENGIDTSFLSAFHPESEASKNAELIDKTLGESAKLIWIQFHFNSN